MWAMGQGKELQKRIETLGEPERFPYLVISKETDGHATSEPC
jgi:hypothetical protein